MHNHNLHRLSGINCYFDIHSVYIYRLLTTNNSLSGIAIDATWFAVYTFKSPVFKFAEGKHLIALVFNELISFSQKH